MNQAQTVAVVACTVVVHTVDCIVAEVAVAAATAFVVAVAGRIGVAAADCNVAAVAAAAGLEAYTKFAVYRAPAAIARRTMKRPQMTAAKGSAATLGTAVSAPAVDLHASAVNGQRNLPRVAAAAAVA